MANMGLLAGLSGLAQGLGQGYEQGLERKTKQQQYDDAKAMQRKQFALELASKNMAQNADNPEQFDYTPEYYANKKSQGILKAVGDSDKATVQFDEKGNAVGYKPNTSGLKGLQAIKDQLQIQEMQQKMQDQAQAKTPEGKIKALPGEKSQKFEYAREGLQRINDMTEALNSGKNPEYFTSDTPLIGGLLTDNAFTEAKRDLSDIIGRMRSGGAINRDEEKRFKAMLPRPGDNKETIARKIEQVRAMFENNIRTFGLQPEELSGVYGYKKTELANNPSKGLLNSQLTPNANAGGKPKAGTRFRDPDGDLMEIQPDGSAIQVR